jgi:hypothetical protein
LTAGKTSSASPGRKLNLLGQSLLLRNVELTFLGHPFESLGRALDSILAVIAIGREQTEHLIGAAGGRTGNITGSKIDGLSNGEFSTPSPSRKTPRALSRLPRLTDSRPLYSIAPAALASYIRTLLRIFELFQYDKGHFGSA